MHSDFIPYNPKRYTEDQMRSRIHMLEKMHDRRSVREFAPDPVPIDVVRKCIEIAGTAPSGAHKQPWTFCLVTDPEIDARYASPLKRRSIRTTTAE